MNNSVHRILVIVAFWGMLLSISGSLSAQSEKVPVKVMNQIYSEIKTPFKYGLVLIPEDITKMVDSPSIYRHRNKWYMTYIVFDGKGYETWLARSSDLLNWKLLGKLLSSTENTWDSNQKAGYIALQNYNWGGSYKIRKFAHKYWMSYLGGATQGYEAGTLGIGIASSENAYKPNEWQTLGHPVISAKDTNARWYDNVTIFKSTVIYDKSKITGHPFVMYYNAKGGNLEHGKALAERIAMAVSDDMVNWNRYGENPVIDHHTGISGDAFITRINNVWVMFYFGAFWKPGAFDRFACSYDLVNWTDWEGEDLIAPSESYDDQYAHKPFVVKYKNIVYHFYCAVNKQGQRGIAVATSIDKGKSKLNFPHKMK